jgi:hypothetical protein
MDRVTPLGPSTPPPLNGFVPVPGCWLCRVLDSVTRSAWSAEEGLSLRDWLSATASGMRHRMVFHGVSPDQG